MEMLSSVNNTTEMLSLVNNTGNNYGKCRIIIHGGELPDVHRKFFSLIYWVNVPVTVIPNVFLIFALSRTNQLRNTTIKLLVAVMFSDAFGGILVFPLMGAALITTGSQYNCLLRKVTEYLAIACLTFLPENFCSGIRKPLSTDQKTQYHHQ